MSFARLDHTQDGTIAMNYDWYETWVDESPDTPYVLFPDPQRQGGILIVDPREANKVVFQAADYESGKLWLLEDEFTRIEGRMTA